METEIISDMPLDVSFWGLSNASRYDSQDSNVNSSNS